MSRANCWKCGPHPVYQALRALTGVRWAEVKPLLGSIIPDAPEARTFGKYTPPPGLIPLTTRDAEYLRDRGFADPYKLAETYGLMSLGPTTPMRKGIFIPITHKGRPVSWTIRHREGNPRYSTATDEEKTMHEKSVLFGAEHCQDVVLVVEGPFDRFKVGYGAACVFGLQYTAAQVRAISKFHRRWICFDNSPDAQAVAARLCNDLSVFPGETGSICLDAADPGSASPEEILELRRYVGLE